MMGGALPGTMMGSGQDMGKAMGGALANSAAPVINPTAASLLGDHAPAGATIDLARQRLTFTTPNVRLTALASPTGGPDETFRIAGMVNPTIEVLDGARVQITVVNADPDTAHGLVVTSPGAASSWMPMITTRPAFAGSAVWTLGAPTPAGMHTATLTFTATTPGSYRYLCAAPRHAQEGMVGSFIVER
jgi:rusticyanin